MRSWNDYLRCGLEKRAIESMSGSLAMEDASYLLGRKVKHGERRAEELRQVASTLKESGSGTLACQRRYRAIAMAGGSAPTNFRVIAI